MSHPVWVRGLKRFGKFKNALAELSHPVWVRGLKLESKPNINEGMDIVAPRVGAWIETGNWIRIG